MATVTQAIIEEMLRLDRRIADLPTTSPGSSRCIAVARTNLDQAALWLAKASGDPDAFLMLGRRV